MKKEARTVLQQVLRQHLEQELSQVPGEQEIRKQHSFSRHFQEKMEKLINEQGRIIRMEKKKKVRSRRKIILQAAAACLAVVLVGSAGYAALTGLHMGSSMSYSADQSEDTGAAGIYNGDYENQKRAATEVAEEAAEEEYGAEDTAAAAGASEGTAATESVKGNQKLIYTIRLDVETTEYDTLWTDIREKVEQLGGYIENSEVSGDPDRHNRSAYMTIRIPAEKRNELTETVKTTASVTYSSESVEDVTLNYVDTQSRIESLRTEQQTLLSLLEKAEDIDTVLAIQNQLTEVRYQLESYESQLKVMENQISYSTLYLSINEVERVTLPEEGTFLTKLQERFVNSLYALGEGAQGFLLFILGDLPILLVVALGIVVVVLIVRKVFRKKKTDQENPPEEPEK